MRLPRRAGPAIWPLVSLLAVLSAGCTAASDTSAGTGGASTNPSAATVSGVVTLPQDAIVPTTARLEVSLQDVSVDDQGEVSTVTLPLTGRVAPYGWRIVYDPATVDAEGSYTVSARILVGSKARFSTASPVAVITDVNPTSDVQLTLVAT